MKRLIYYSLLITALLSTSFVFSQDTIGLASRYVPEEGLQLKWFPGTEEVFIQGFQKGYIISRAEVLKTSQGGETRTEFKKLTDQPIKYWSFDQLKEAYEKDTTVGLASIFIEGADELINRKYKTTPTEAAEQKKQDEFLHLLGLLAAISNNTIAEAIGLYIVDKEVEKGKKYLYKIEVPDHENYTSYLLINSVEEKELPKIIGTTVSLRPQVVHLSWYNNRNKTYPYFNIYKATKKNGKYTKLNEIPFTGDINRKFDKNYTTYDDTIRNYGEAYYYKIAGVGVFGEEGIYSDPLEIETKYLLQHTPSVTNSVETPNTSDIELTWEVREEEEKYIKNFNVFRASSGNGTYQRVNEKTLDAKDRSYIDRQSKGSSNYYVVTAYGEAGDSLNSIVRAHLLLDSIPPEQPELLEGICDTNGILTLKWTLNKEPDLEGYRIFKTYDTLLDPIRVIPGDTLVEAFVDTVVLGKSYNAIYYRIYAIDNHYNPSIPSKYLKVILPDKHPPLSGFLIDYAVGMNGVALKWVNSASYDLAKMHLMRKAETDFQFYPILTLQGDSLSIKSYTDTSTKSNVTYQYAMMAEDEAGLQSELSKVFSVRQLNKDKKLSVTNLKAIVSKENRIIKLSWDYPSYATGFRIYRSEDDGPLKTYKYISGREREFYDKNIKPNTSYTYLMIGELKGGHSSGYSNKIEVKY